MGLGRPTTEPFNVRIRTLPASCSLTWNSACTPATVQNVAHDIAR
jgi:hypothetical protein